MLRINITQGKRYTFKTHINEVVLPREQAEIVEAFRVIIEPGKSTHFHVHDDTEQLYYVISGSGRALFVHPDGRQDEFDMLPQDVIHVPRNTKHRISCAGQEALIYLCVDAFPQGKPAAEPTWEHHFRVVQALQEREA